MPQLPLSLVELSKLVVLSVVENLEMEWITQEAVAAPEQYVLQLQVRVAAAGAQNSPTTRKTTLIQSPRMSARALLESLADAPPGRHDCVKPCRRGRWILLACASVCCRATCRRWIASPSSTLRTTNWWRCPSISASRHVSRNPTPDTL